MNNNVRIIIIYINMEEHTYCERTTNKSHNKSRKKWNKNGTTTRISIHNDASRHNFDYRIANFFGRKGGGGGGEGYATSWNTSKLVEHHRNTNLNEFLGKTILWRKYRSWTITREKRHQHYRETYLRETHLRETQYVSLIIF